MLLLNASLAQNNHLLTLYCLEKPQTATHQPALFIFVSLRKSARQAG